MTPPSTAEMDEEHVPLTASQKSQEDGDSPKAGSSSSSNRVTTGDEEVAVCRICLEEDTCSNLEAPCSCSGTMKHAHHSCLQRWCNEKGDLTCEICKQPFRGDFEEPPPPPPRSQHVTVWGQEYLIVADPETGTIRAHRLQELFDEEDAEEEATRLQTGTAWWFTAILLALCLLLVRHLFSLFSSAGAPSGGAGTGHAAGEGGSSGSGGGGTGGGSQGQAPHHHGEEADSAFEDLSMTLLILWLLVRMLVMIAPFYTVWGGAAAWARGRAANWHSEQGQHAQRGDSDAQTEPDAVAEIELEQRLDRIIQRMEAGAADGEGDDRENGAAHQEERQGLVQEGHPQATGSQPQEGQHEEQQQQQQQQQHRADTGQT